MIWNEAQLAKNVQNGIDRFMEYVKQMNASYDQVAAGGMMISLFLQAMGLKTSEEGVRAALDRMNARAGAYDLLNEEHRHMAALIWQSILEPLGVRRVAVIGISGEGRTFITEILREGDETWTPEQFRSFFEALAEDEGMEFI